jgi:hypothetical protein
LLVAEIFVCRHQNLEPWALGIAGRFAILQFFPPTGAGLRDGVMIDQITSKSARGASNIYFRTLRYFCAR